MIIFVKIDTVVGYKTIIIEIEPDYTIQYLKQKIEEKECINKYIQDIVYCGNIISDNTILKDAEILEQSTVFVMISFISRIKPINLDNKSNDKYLEIFSGLNYMIDCPNKLCASQIHGGYCYIHKNYGIITLNDIINKKINCPICDTLSPMETFGFINCKIAFEGILSDGTYKAEEKEFDTKLFYNFNDIVKLKDYKELTIKVNKR